MFRKNNWLHYRHHVKIALGFLGAIPLFLGAVFANNLSSLWGEHTTVVICFILLIGLIYFGISCYVNDPGKILLNLSKEKTNKDKLRLIKKAGIFDFIEIERAVKDLVKYHGNNEYIALTGIIHQLDPSLNSQLAQYWEKIKNLQYLED